MDWALLAKQWIKMKEDGIQIPPAPIISNYQPDDDDDKSGTADMDLENENEQETSVAEATQYLNTLQQKNQAVSPWANNWNPIQSTPFQPHIQPQNTWKPVTTAHPWVNATPFPINPSTLVKSHSLLASGSESMNLYSIASESKPRTPSAGPTSHHTDLWTANSSHLSKPHITIANETPSNLTHEDMTLDNSDSEDTTQTIDTKARKMLPAWIREGLEKMEREKQKEAERQRELRERERLLEQRKKEEEAALLELQREKASKKFESGDESSEEESNQYPKIPEKISLPEFSQKPVSRKFETQKSREEQQQEMMKTMRQTLTEILLDVTNEMILEISNETISKFRKKVPTVQLRKNVNALTSLTGLEVYSGSSDSEEDSDQENGTDNAGDSDTELKERIKRRVSQFECKAKEIEEYLEMEQKKEENLREQDDDDEISNSETGRIYYSEDSVKKNKEGMMEKYDTIYSISGRGREKRQSRFSDPGDTVRSTHVTHVSMPQLNRYHSDSGSNNGRPFSSVSGVIPEIKSPASSSKTDSGHGRKHSNSSDDSSDTSNSDQRRRKHKKHKKSSSRKKHREEKSRHDEDRDYEYRTRRRRSERSSIESKGSIRSDRSEKSRRHSRSRSRSRDRHHHHRN